MRNLRARGENEHGLGCINSIRTRCSEVQRRDAVAQQETARRERSPSHYYERIEHPSLATRRSLAITDVMSATATYTPLPPQQELAGVLPLSGKEGDSMYVVGIQLTLQKGGQPIMMMR